MRIPPVARGPDRGGFAASQLRKHRGPYRAVVPAAVSTTPHRSARRVATARPGGIRAGGQPLRRRTRQRSSAPLRPGASATAPNRRRARKSNLTASARAVTPARGRARSSPGDATRPRSSANVRAMDAAERRPRPSGPRVHPGHASRAHDRREPDHCARTVARRTGLDQRRQPARTRRCSCPTPGFPAAIDDLGRRCMRRDDVRH